MKVRAEEREERLNCDLERKRQRRANETPKEKSLRFARATC